MNTDLDKLKDTILKTNRAQGLPELEMGIGLNETEAIVGKPGILQVGVSAATGDLFGPLQHPVHFVEVDVTEQG